MRKDAWPRHHLDLLCDKYAEVGGVGVARLLGIDRQRVYDKAKALGLHVGKPCLSRHNRDEGKRFASKA